MLSPVFFFVFFFLSIQISSFPREQYDFCSFYFSCFWSHTFFTQLFVVLPLLSRADKELVLAERKHRPTNQRFQISPFFFRPSSVDDVSLTDPGQRKVRESKFCVENGYGLCGRAVAIALLLLNYQMQIKLECRERRHKNLPNLAVKCFIFLNHSWVVALMAAVWAQLVTVHAMKSVKPCEASCRPRQHQSFFFFFFFFLGCCEPPCSLYQ